MLNIRHFLLLLFFFALTPAFGQGEYKTAELQKILDDIEKQHKVKFSYLDADIKGISIIPPRAVLPLKAKLKYIEIRTGLSYKESGANYIILYRETQKQHETACGFVLDTNQTPLENATITLADGTALFTGSDGYFELPDNRSGILTISYVGFETKSFDTGSFKRDCKQIMLNSTVQLLEEVVTDVYLTTGISKKKDGSFIIKPKKFGILPGLIEPDVLLAMQQLPGINSIDETVSNINVRGGTHDQNLFMWNGIRLFQTGHFFGLISALNPNPAYDIKIYKNGTSAFYGESVSSAIDISSRSEFIGPHATSIGSNMINADFYTRIKASDNAGFEISARRSFTDVIDLPTYSRYSRRIFQNTIVTEVDNNTDVNYRNDKEFYFYDFTAQYHQKISDKHNLYINAIGIKNNLDFTEGTFFATSISALDQFTLGGTAAWHTQWNDTHKSEASVYSSYYNLDGQTVSVNTDNDLRQQNTIRDTGLRLSNTNILNTTTTLHTGYQFNQTSIKNTEIQTAPIVETVKSVLRTHALIAEAEYTSPNELISARVGARGNYIEQFSKLYFEPRLQFNYTMSNAWSLEVLGELKSQTASQAVELQDDFLGLEKRRWILANNDNIPLQQSSQLSGGITYKDNGWLLSLEHFYKKVNGITTGGQAFQNQLENIAATGSYAVQGTEILVQKQFSNMYAWLSYTWNNNNYEFPEFSQYKFPSNFEINHAINSAVIYEVYNFKIALGARWFTGRPVTNPLLAETSANVTTISEILYESPNLHNIDNFFQANFSANYLWKVSDKVRLQFGVSVLNLFNRQNIINRYYRINPDSNAIEVVNTYSVERTPNAMVKLSF